MSAGNAMGSCVSAHVAGAGRSNEYPGSDYVFRPFNVEEAVSNGSPHPRSGHAALACGRYMVVFGGYYAPLQGSDSPKTFTKVWVFDFLARKWQKLDPDKCSQVAPDAVASSAISVVDQKLYVFGGSYIHFGFSSSNTFHQFDLVSHEWQLVSCRGNAPEPLYGHSICYDDKSQCMYVFGGTDGSDFFDATYVLSMSDHTWSKVCCTGKCPEARYTHRAIPCADGFYVVFGGLGNVALHEDVIHHFSYANQKWTQVQCVADEEHGSPQPRRAPAVAFNSQYAIVCGGTSEEVAAMDDVWRLDIVSGKPPAVIVGTSCQIHGKWRKLPVSLKEPIFFHTAVLSEYHCLYVFGGNVRCGLQSVKRSGDCYSIDVGIPPLTELAWRCLISKYPWLQNLPKAELRALGIPQILLY